MMDALVAAHSNAPTSASPRLRALLHEVRPAMAWGHLREDNVMTALSNGSKEGIWVMLIDPGHDTGFSSLGPRCRRLWTVACT